MPKENLAPNYKDSLKCLQISGKEALAGIII